MIEVKKKSSESLASLLRRFNRKVQQSGILVQARKVRFYERPKSRQKIKESAIRRAKIAKQKEYFRKIGKDTDFVNKRIRVK